MRIRLEARPEPSRLASWLSPAIATLAVLCIGRVLFSAMGKNPWQALYVFFIEPVDTLYDVGRARVVERSLPVSQRSLARCRT